MGAFAACIAHKDVLFGVPLTDASRAFDIIGGGSLALSGAWSAEIGVHARHLQVPGHCSAFAEHQLELAAQHLGLGLDDACVQAMVRHMSGGDTSVSLAQWLATLQPTLTRSDDALPRGAFSVVSKPAPGVDSPSSALPAADSAPQGSPSSPVSPNAGGGWEAVDATPTAARAGPRSGWVEDSDSSSSSEDGVAVREAAARGVGREVGVYPPLPPSHTDSGTSSPHSSVGTGPLPATPPQRASPSLPAQQTAMPAAVRRFLTRGQAAAPAPAAEAASPPPAPASLPSISSSSSDGDDTAESILVDAAPGEEGQSTPPVASAPVTQRASPGSAQRPRATTQGAEHGTPPQAPSALGGLLSPELTALLEEMDADAASSGGRGGDRSASRPPSVPSMSMPSPSPLTSTEGPGAGRGGRWGEDDDVVQLSPPRRPPPSAQAQPVPSRGPSAPPSVSSGPLRLSASPGASGTPPPSSTRATSPVPDAAVIVAPTWHSPTPFSTTLAHPRYITSLGAAPSRAATATAPATASGGASPTSQLVLTPPRVRPPAPTPGTGILSLQDLAEGALSLTGSPQHSERGGGVASPSPPPHVTPPEHHAPPALPSAEAPQQAEHTAPVSPPERQDLLAHAHSKLNEALAGMQERVAAVLHAPGRGGPAPPPQNASPPPTMDHVRQAQGASSLDHHEAPAPPAPDSDTVVALQGELADALEANAALQAQLAGAQGQASALQADLDTALGQLDAAASALELAAETQAKASAAQADAGTSQQVRAVLGLALLWRQVWVMHAVATALGMQPEQCAWLQRLLSTLSRTGRDGGGVPPLNLGATVQVIPSPVLSAARAVAAASTVHGGDGRITAGHVATACTVVMPAWADAPAHAAVTRLALTQLDGAGRGRHAAAALPPDALLNACKAVVATQFLANVQGQGLPDPDTASLRGLLATAPRQGVGLEGGHDAAAAFGAMVLVEGAVDITGMDAAVPSAAGGQGGSPASPGAFSLPGGGADTTHDLQVGRGAAPVLPARSFRFPVSRFLGATAPASALVGGLPPPPDTFDAVSHSARQEPSAEATHGSAPGLAVLAAAVAGGLLDTGLVLAAPTVDTVQGSVGPLHCALLESLWKGVEALRTAVAVEAAAGQGQGGGASTEGPHPDVVIGLSYAGVDARGRCVDLLSRAWEQGGVHAGEQAACSAADLHSDPHVVLAPTLDAALRCAELGFTRRVQWSTAALCAAAGVGDSGVGGHAPGGAGWPAPHHQQHQQPAAQPHLAQVDGEAGAASALATAARKVVAESAAAGQGYAQGPGSLAPHPAACGFTHGILRMHLLRRRGGDAAAPLRSRLSQLQDAFSQAGSLVAVELGPQCAAAPRLFGFPATAGVPTGGPATSLYAAVTQCVWQALDGNAARGASAHEADPLLYLLSAALTGGRVGLATVATSGPDVPQLLQRGGPGGEGVRSGRGAAARPSPAHVAASTAALGGFTQYGAGLGGGSVQSAPPSPPSPSTTHRPTSTLATLTPGSARYTLMASLETTPLPLQPLAFATCMAATATPLVAPSSPSATVPWGQLLAAPTAAVSAAQASTDLTLADALGTAVSLPGALERLGRPPSRHAGQAALSDQAPASRAGSAHAASRRHGGPTMSLAQRRQSTQRRIAARTGKATDRRGGSRPARRRSRAPSLDSSATLGDLSGVTRAASVASSSAPRPRQVGPAQPGRHPAPSDDPQFAAMMAAAVAAAAATQVASTTGSAGADKPAPPAAPSHAPAPAVPATALPPLASPAPAPAPAAPVPPAGDEPGQGGQQADPVPGMRRVLGWARAAWGGGLPPHAFGQLLAGMHREHNALLMSAIRSEHPALRDWASRQAVGEATLPPQAFATGLRSFAAGLSPKAAWELVVAMHLEHDTDIDFVEFVEALETLYESESASVLGSSRQVTGASSQYTDLSQLDAALQAEEQALSELQ